MLEKPRIDSFFAELKKGQPTLATALDFITRPYKETYFAFESGKTKKRLVERYNSLASIKYPGKQRWEIFDPTRSIITFTPKISTLKKFDTAEEFGTRKIRYPGVIILETKNIPIPLTLSKNNDDEVALPPAFISNIPGTTKHAFKEITTQEFTLSSVIGRFFQIEDLRETKEFTIKKLTGLSSLSKPGSQETITLTDVKLVNLEDQNPNWKPQQLISFKLNGHPYHIDLIKKEKKGNEFFWKKQSLDQAMKKIEHDEQTRLLNNLASSLYQLAKQD